MDDELDSKIRKSGLIGGELFRRFLRSCQRVPLYKEPFFGCDMYQAYV